MNIVCISDLHGPQYIERFPLKKNLDVLIIAGDFSGEGSTGRGTFVEVQTLAIKLKNLPIKHKIIVAGNHDCALQKQETSPIDVKGLLSEFIYLEDSSVEIDGIKFWGMPWTPSEYDWSFSISEDEMKSKTDLIPEGTDVLITHGPPKGILDRVLSDKRFETKYEDIGSLHLMSRIKKIKPRYHVFGHVHNQYGIYEQEWNKDLKTTFINCSQCNDRYHNINRPIYFSINNSE